MTDSRRLLLRAITRSGLSHRQYAQQVLTRDERTVRRWLAGTSNIPKAVVFLLMQEEKAIHLRAIR
jgi:hypothetical protein